MKRRAGIRPQSGDRRSEVRCRRSEKWARKTSRYFLWIAPLIFLFSLAAPADAPDIALQLDVSSVGPRKIEPQTEGRIVADYRLAWIDIAHALSVNDPAPFGGLFVGSAKNWLEGSVAGQRQSGITTRVSDQSHELQAVFYAPEGDLIELHDTAEYDTQVLAGDKVIHQDRSVHRYVVLMTPGADRWVIRELMEVAQF